MLTYKDFLPHTPVTDAMPKGLAFNFGLNGSDASTGDTSTGDTSTGDPSTNETEQ